MRKRAVLAALAAFICFTGASAAVEMKEKWVIYSANFEDDTSVDRFIRVVEQARAAGCTHVFVDDPQFGFINEIISSAPARPSRNPALPSRRASSPSAIPGLTSISIRTSPPASRSRTRLSS